MFISRLFLWLANRLPNFFLLRYFKGVLLYLAGVDLNPLGVYYLSPINMDRPKSIAFRTGVFLNRNCTFEGVGKVFIGNNVQIGPNVVFATTNHVLGNMDEVVGEIHILDNVWIGANVVILQGVRIGPNVIVGAGAVVTKSFDNCTVIGVPAHTK